MTVVLILLVVFVLIWIFTRDNIANFALVIPIWALLIYIILHQTDTWIQIACETMAIFILLISMIRALRRV
jgi:hypothetical protein